MRHGLVRVRRGLVGCGVAKKGAAWLSRVRRGLVRVRRGLVRVWRGLIRVRHGLIRVLVPRRLFFAAQQRIAIT